MDCAQCHHPDNWTYLPEKSSFNHDSTGFALTGRHDQLECRSCHQTLEFTKAESACISCHQDVHQQTAGYDCARCHQTNSWIVENITAIHEATAFPLMGVHSFVDCRACHISETNLRFAPVGVTCYDCHRQDYENTNNPDHVANHFDTDCAQCHSLNGTDWGTDVVEHTFFPLEKGHAIADCKACHTSAIYSDISNQCIACHAQDFAQTMMPNHQLSGFSNNCTSCHTIDPGWSPAHFAEHDQGYFPIYSGSHKDVWSACTDCHTDPTNYKTQSCTVCHLNPETNNVHENVAGYSYSDGLCLACHPTGEAENAFNHDNTAFPLTGAHRMVDCNSCHNGVFEGTPTNCSACHLTDFNQTQNPNHAQVGFDMDCAKCHTTAPGWNPASFDDHDVVYKLNGAHALIKEDCAACHMGNYNQTPNTCAGCHKNDYDGAKQPDHLLNQFSLDCAGCHSENAWQPSTFDHDMLHFPIYSGKHNGVWNDCMDCHHVQGDLSQFTCTTCHMNPETDNQHETVGGYIYSSNACLACHPTGDADVVFDHNMTGFPLTGAHKTTQCIDCHQNGFEGTPSDCVSCHFDDYTLTTNPNHQNLGIEKDCKMCHTTTPGWQPAIFPNHDQFHPLYGAHALIAENCIACHNGDYNNTPNTCYGCHQQDYNQTVDPDHELLQFPQNCSQCHNEQAWIPSVFDHDNAYFPIYSGKHAGVWTQCMDCHDNPANWAQFTCTTCHTNPETDDDHFGVPGYVYQSNACLACHPTGDGDVIFDHNMTGFPLTGAHLALVCLDCHTNGFEGTPSTCVSCHQQDYNASLNPNHQSINLPTDCALCHSTVPGWAPAGFPIHDQYYDLQGAHATIANDCAACHNGNYNNTPNTCFGCHQPDYNGTTDPDHEVAMLPTDCILCHTQNAWTPTQFDHAVFWPLTGAHADIKDDCASCHMGNYENTSSACVSCHQDDFNQTANPNHQTLMFGEDCASCHTTAPGWSPALMPDHDQYYVIEGAHLAIANDCAACHNGDYNNTPNTCVGCHLSDFNNTMDPDHELNQFPQDCALCHSQLAWTPSTFDHNQYYPLVGAHAAIANDCVVCHQGDYNNTPNTCVGCHQDDYNNTTNPDHELGNFPTNCIVCHSQNAWVPADFNHDMVYPLTGAHATIADQCVLCHIGGYSNTPTTCAGCHQDDYNTSMNPNHGSLGFPTDCALCHTTVPGWSPASMPNHDDYYVIAGAHLAIANDCAACHNGDYNNTPNTCFGCHASDYNAALDPNHMENQFPTDCILCHDQNAWTPSSFDHNNYYPLTGAHALIADDCVACHNGDYNNTPNTCAGCHTPDYNSAENPNHVALGLSTTCTTCHTTNPGWSPATFPDHDNYYPILGAHIGLDCVDCHNGDYNNTPNTCFACHTADFNAALDPNHAVNQFPHDCTLCHSQDSWTPSTFNHDNYYPLTGAHAAIADDCVVCHNGDYNNTPNTCAGCHTPDYNSAVNPNHVSLGLSTNCTTCHTTNPGWSPATFPDHNNYYPILGAHTGLDCVDCHNGDYNNTPNTCIGCHSADYNAALDPNHQANQFPTDCTLCHSQDAWLPSTFNHDNYYPLTGAHASIANDCILCHNGNYNNTPNTCAGCHTPDYNNALNPNHVNLNLPNDCVLCHTTDPGWSPATFPIHDNYYVLQGAHLSLDCVDCHNGNYNNPLPNTCVGCHLSDYQNTNNPDHEAAMFPTDCTACHNQNGWTPSTFDHDNMYFPIYSGRHDNEWNTCSDCHFNPNNYSLFSCIDCHEHDDQNQVDDDHQGVPGYQYNSNACYDCHPTGEN